MVAPAPVGSEGALDGVVVGLGAAAGENEFVAMAFEQFGHLRRAALTPSLALRPNRWPLEGLPKCS